MKNTILLLIVFCLYAFASNEDYQDQLNNSQIEVTK